MELVPRCCSLYWLGSGMLSRESLVAKPVASSGSLLGSALCLNRVPWPGVELRGRGTSFPFLIKSASRETLQSPTCAQRSPSIQGQAHFRLQSKIASPSHSASATPPSPPRELVSSLCNEAFQILAYKLRRYALDDDELSATQPLCEQHKERKGGSGGCGCYEGVKLHPSATEDAI